MSVALLFMQVQLAGHVHLDEAHHGVDCEVCLKVQGLDDLAVSPQVAPWIQSSIHIANVQPIIPIKLTFFYAQPRAPPAYLS